MPFYRKKPIVIEAIQYNGNNKEEILNFMDNNHYQIFEDGIVIYTLEGNMKISPNDWVIKGVKGEFYPCKPDIFEASYEIEED